MRNFPNFSERKKFFIWIPSFRVVSVLNLHQIPITWRISRERMNNLASGFVFSQIVKLNGRCGFGALVSEYFLFEQNFSRPIPKFWTFLFDLKCIYHKTYGTIWPQLGLSTHIDPKSVPCPETWRFCKFSIPLSRELFIGLKSIIWQFNWDSHEKISLSTKKESWLRLYRNESNQQWLRTFSSITDSLRKWKNFHFGRKKFIHIYAGRHIAIQDLMSVVKMINF